MECLTDYWWLVLGLCVAVSWATKQLTLWYGFREWDATCPGCGFTVPGRETRCPRCSRRIERVVPVREVAPEEQRRQRIILAVLMVLVLLYLLYTYVLAPGGAQ